MYFSAGDFTLFEKLILVLLYIIVRKHPLCIFQLETLPCLHQLILPLVSTETIFFALAIQTTHTSIQVMPRQLRVTVTSCFVYKFIRDL